MGGGGGVHACVCVSVRVCMLVCICIRMGSLVNSKIMFLHASISLYVQFLSYFFY